MPYAKPFVLMTVTGTLANNNEIWNTGYKLANYSGTATPQQYFDNAVDHIDELGTAVESYIALPAMNVPQGALLSSLKLSLKGTDGLDMAEPVEIEISGAGASGGSYSPQDAMVVTLDSGKWKDPGKYNRNYLPTAGPQGSGFWRFTTAEQTEKAQATADFINDVNEILSDPSADNELFFSVVSGTREGYQDSVAYVRVGAIVDTQRRRRNNLDEDYITVAVIQP